MTVLACSFSGYRLIRVYYTLDSTRLGTSPMKPILVIVLQCVVAAFADLGGVVVMVLSQTDNFHSQRAIEKQQQWTEDMNTWNITNSTVLLAHEQWELYGTWTVTPLIPLLSTRYRDATWFFFAGEETEIKFGKLKELLEGYDPTLEYFLGHALRDMGRTIIHHYVRAEAILFPNLPSGVILSAPALHKAAEHYNSFNPNFNIDPQYELAVFLKYLSSPALVDLFPDPPPPHPEGILLTHTPQLCAGGTPEENCATNYIQDIPQCGKVGLQAVFFAVKTCEKYHSSRLPVLQSTWAGDAHAAIAYYSEVEDPHYSTTDLGVPNSEQGHCMKTMAIIDRFHSEQIRDGKQWLVIADDDTLLSVSRLLRLLACYDSSRPILLGEVYGYQAHHAHGTTYITGGGGMVLSREAVRRIVDTGYHCPSLDTPDDMYLGTIARQLEIDIIHSPLFHQSQPESFHPAILRLQTHISFHRHHPRDPLLVYKEYLMDDPTKYQRGRGQKTEL